MPRLSFPQGKDHMAQDGTTAPMSGPSSRLPICLKAQSGLAENPVEVRATDWTRGFCHAGALVIDDDVAGCLALFLALDAVELARVGLGHLGLLCVLVLLARRAPVCDQVLKAPPR